MYLFLLEILLKGLKNKILFLNDFASIFLKFEFQNREKGRSMPKRIAISNAIRLNNHLGFKNYFVQGSQGFILHICFLIRMA